MIDEAAEDVSRRGNIRGNRVSIAFTSPVLERNY
jgi:hypothetical protein